MTDYTKPFPCGECGKMVYSNEKHTLDDCMKFKKVQTKKMTKHEERMQRNIEEMWVMIAEIVKCLRANGLEVPKVNKARFHPAQKKLKVTPSASGQ